MELEFKNSDTALSVERYIKFILRANNINIPHEIVAYYLYCEKAGMMVSSFGGDMPHIDIWRFFGDILEKNSADTFARIVLFSESDGWRSNYGTSESLINLSDALLDIKEGETVADMGCGKGNFILSTAHKYPAARYFGFDISKEDVLIAKIKVAVAKQYGYISRNTEISIREQDIFALQRELATSNGKKYNKVFSHYPFNMRKTEVPWDDKIKDLITIVSTANWAFHYLVYNMLEKGGKGIVIMPTGATFNHTEKRIRQYFLEEGYMEAVISLPGGMLNEAMVPVCALLLSNNPEENKKGICIYSVTSYQKGRRQNSLNKSDIDKIVNEYHNNFVRMETIRERNYEIHPSVYYDKTTLEIETVPFGSLTVGERGITRAGALLAKELDDLKSEEDTNCYYLNSADIRDGEISDNLPRLKTIPERNRRFILEDNSFIITKNAPYKMAYVKTTNGRNILVNGNIYIIKLDTKKVNPYFVKAFFESKKGMELLNSISTGSIISNISLDTLSNMPFPKVPVEKQNEIAAAYLACSDKIKAKNKELNELKTELDTVCDSVFAQ